MQPTQILARAFTFALAMLASTAAFADDKAWSVRKSSGEVWVTTAGAQQVSLTPEAGLKPGDAVRTGRNGRVLLVRGEESILLSPNSAIGIPAEAKDGLATTIVQQAGSILLEVEKRNVKHFEVETPYLAAVVKGTKFSVTVSATGTSVNVTRGQVEVADFRSGQIAQVMPGQFAKSFAQGKVGLSLSGTGNFAPIEQGKPRAPSIERLMVPRNGLPAPRNAANQPMQPLGQIKAVAGAPARPGAAALQPGQATADLRAAPRGLRIASPIGDVRLNFQRVTNSVARGVGAVTPSGRAVASQETTIWNGRDGRSSIATASGVGSGSETASNAGVNAASFASGAAVGSATAGSVAGNGAASNAAAVATAGNAASSNAGGNASGATGNGRRSSSGSVAANSGNAGNGNSSSNGNGNGNGNSSGSNGNSGSGSGSGNGNGNSGNGNGNGGVGNGNGNGNSKH